jgi:mRNA interferase RelE/StbE
MKKYLVQYTTKARKDLQALDKPVARRIVLKVEYYSQLDDPLVEAKRLTGNLDGLYRYRVGNYRIVFEVSDTGLLVLMSIVFIEHRKDVYR